MTLVHFVPRAQAQRLAEQFPNERWPQVMLKFCYSDQELQQLRTQAQRRDA